MNDLQLRALKPKDFLVTELQSKLIVSRLRLN